MEKKKSPRSLRREIDRQKEKVQKKNGEVSKKPKNRQGMLFLMFGVVSFLIALTFTNTNPKKSPKKEAEKIIQRATEISQEIPDPKNKAEITDMLKRMVVVFPDKNDNVEVPEGATCLVVLKKGELKGPDMTTEDFSTSYMAFNGEILEKQNRIVVALSDDPELTQHVDIKATSLIHELIHVLQSMDHLQKGIKITPQIVYEDEKIAYESQMYLFNKLHPELMEGIKCDCTSLTIHNMTPKQERIIMKDKLMQTIILAGFCKDAILSRMYPTK